MPSTPDQCQTNNYNEEVKILQLASYKGLQTIAKEYGLPTYIKKHEIISLIVLQRAGRTDDVELARQEFKRSRAQKRDILEPRPQRKCCYASSAEERSAVPQLLSPSNQLPGKRLVRKAQPKRSRAAHKERPGRYKQSKAVQLSSAAWNERAEQAERAERNEQAVIVQPADTAWEFKYSGNADAVQPCGSIEHASDLNNNRGMGSVFAQHGSGGYGPSYWNHANSESVKSYGRPISSSFGLDSNSWNNDAYNIHGMNAQMKHSHETGTFSYRSEVTRRKSLSQPAGSWREASEEQVWKRPSHQYNHPPPASSDPLYRDPGPRVCRYPREGGKWMLRHPSGPRSPPFSRQQSSVVGKSSLLLKRTESHQQLDTTLSFPSFRGADQKLSYPLILEYLTSSETQLPQQSLPAGSSATELVTKTRVGSASLDTKGLAFTHSYDSLYRHDQSSSFSSVAPQVSSFDSRCNSSVPEISRNSSSWNVQVSIASNTTSSLGPFCGSVPDSILVEPTVLASPASFSRFESAGGSCYLNPTRTNMLPSNRQRPCGSGVSLPCVSGSASEIFTTPFIPYPLKPDRHVLKTEYARRWTESWDISRTTVSNGPVIGPYFNTPAAVSELNCYPVPDVTLASSVPESGLMDNRVFQTPRSVSTFPAHPKPLGFPACSQKPSATSMEYLQQPDYPYFCTQTDEALPEYSQPNNPQECTQYRISDYPQSDSSSSPSELSQTIQPSITLHYYPDSIQADAVHESFEDLNLDSLDCSQLKSVHPVDLSQYLESAQSVDPKTEPILPVLLQPAQWNSWSGAPDDHSAPCQPAQWDAAGSSALTTAPFPLPSQPVQWSEECSYNANGIVNPVTISLPLPPQPPQWTSWPNAAGSAPITSAFPVVPRPELREDWPNSATSDSFAVASEPALCEKWQSDVASAPPAESFPVASDPALCEKWQSDVASAPPAESLPVVSDPAPCEVWSNPAVSASFPEVSQPAMWEGSSDTETCSVSSSAVCSPVAPQSADTQKRPSQCSRAEPRNTIPDPAVQDHDYVMSPQKSLQLIKPGENPKNCIQMDSSEEAEDVSTTNCYNSKSSALEPLTPFQDPSSTTLRSPKLDLGLNLTNGSPLALLLQCEVPEAEHVVEIHSEGEAVTASSEAQTGCLAVGRASPFGENCSSISSNNMVVGRAEPASSLRPIVEEAAISARGARPTRPSNEEGCSRTRREAARCRWGLRVEEVLKSREDGDDRDCGGAVEGSLCDRADPATGRAMGALLSSREEIHRRGKEEDIGPVVDEAMEARPMCEQTSVDNRSRAQEQTSCSHDRTDPATGQAVEAVLSFEEVRSLNLTPKGVVCSPTKEVMEASRCWIPNSNHIGEGRDEGGARCTNDHLGKAGIPVDDKNDGTSAPPYKRPRLDVGTFRSATSCSLDGDLGEAPGRKQDRRSNKKDARLEVKEASGANAVAATPTGASLRRNPRRSTRSSLKSMEIQRPDPSTPRPERALVGGCRLCRARVPADELSAHKLQCRSNLLRCPRSHCQFRGISSKLYAHIKKAHYSSIKTADVELKCTVKISKVHSEKHVFFLREVSQTLLIIRVYSNKSDIFATLQHISPTNSTPSHAMVGTMEVLLNEEDSHFLWQGEVFPFNNNLPYFQNLDHCLHIILPKMKKQTFNINVRVNPTDSKWKMFKAQLDEC